MCVGMFCKAAPDATESFLRFSVSRINTCAAIVAAFLARVLRWTSNVQTTGAFSLVRQQSKPRSPTNIVYLFTEVASRHAFDVEVFYRYKAQSMNGFG